MRWLCLLVLTLAFAGAWPQETSRSGPAQAIEQLLSLERQDRLEEAKILVNFSGFPSGAQRQAIRDIAEYIRLSGLDPERLGESEGSAPIVLGRMQGPDGQEQGEIALEPNGGGWRFTSTSARQAGQMVAELRRREAEAASAGGKEPTGEPVPEEARGLTSPRQAMETFLIAMNQGDLAAATRVLSLDHLNPVVRPVRGPELASRLYAILNRTEFIQLDTIPNASSGGDWIFASFTTDAGAGIGDIRLSRTADGAWKFPQRTVDQIDAIWQQVRSLPVLAGLEDSAGSGSEAAEWIRSRFPESWSARMLGMEAWQAASLAILLGLGWLIGMAAKLVLRWVLMRRFRRLQGQFDERQRKNLTRGIGIVCGLALLLAALPSLTLPTTTYAFLAFAVQVALAVMLTVLIWSAWTGLINIFADAINADKSRARSLFVPLFHSIGRAVIIGGVLVYIGVRLGLNVAGVVAGLGIGGAILALAAKDSIENLFGSLTILFEAPFGIGDWIKIDGQEGTVEEISLRSTRIRTFSDTLLVMPNSKIITGIVENYGQRRRRRFKATVPLAYATDPARAVEFCRKMREALAARTDLYEDSLYVHLNDFSDKGVEVMVYLFILAPDWTEELRIREEIVQTLLKMAQDDGVKFAVSPEALESLFGVPGHTEGRA
jgi:MscS family membrane protein